MSSVMEGDGKKDKVFKQLFLSPPKLTPRLKVDG